MAKEETICAQCGGSHDVHEVYERFGWGRTETEWATQPTPLCRRCRDKNNGHWKYKDPDRRKRTP